MRSVRSFAAVAILASAAVSASAQPILSAKSGVIANADGKVLIDNTEVQQSVTHFPEVKEGSVVRTEDGRVELMLPPGFMLRMGENGALKMLANRLIDTRVELQAGSAVVEVDQMKPDYNVNVVVKDGVVNLSKVGVYRFDSQPARLKVFHGTATVEIGGQSVIVPTGKMLALGGGLASAEKFDIEQTDSLDNWSRRQAEAMAIANVSGAKYSNSYSSGSGSNWVYNPYYDMYTYMPYSGTICNQFYGLCYYSPMASYQTFFVIPRIGGSLPNVGSYHGNVSGTGIPTASSTWARPVGSGIGSGTFSTGSLGSSSGLGGLGGAHGTAFGGAAGHGK
jgi:hypothetical protein